MFVYKITNNINGKIYIGLDSGPVEKSLRWKSHQSGARRYDKAKNPLFIHKAMNKYGIENFTYEVISEYCTKIELVEAEKYWIRHYKSDVRNFGYNRTAGGELTFWSCLNEDEKINRRREMSINSKNRYALLTEKERKAKAQHLIDFFSNISPEDRKKYASFGAKVIANKLSKTFRLYSPSGDVFDITGLRSFCRDNNLCRTGMLSVSTGERETYKGWRCYKIDEQNNSIIPVLRHKTWKINRVEACLKKQ